MRTTLLVLMAFCMYTCIENTQEKEPGFKLNKPKADSLELYKAFHLGGGLCVIKVSDIYIKIIDCQDLLAVDTATPTENIVKYKQGGLCFYHDCSIDPKESFTVFMNVRKGFTDSNKYLDVNILASRYSHSEMLYKYERIHPGKSEEERLLASGYGHSEMLYKYERIDFGDSEEDMQISQYELEHTLYKIGSREEKPAVEFKLKPDIIKEYNDFWEELFLMSRPLKIKDEDFSDKCNGKFCPTKDFLEPSYKIDCNYKTDYEDVYCYRNYYFDKKNKPECLDRLERLSKGYSILMHGGAFTVGDCDLSNWRYLKIDSLSREHYEKLKEIVKPPDNYYNY